MSDRARELREYFIKQAIKRLGYTLREQPDLKPSIETRVKELAKVAKFELVERDEPLPGDARKALGRFVEIIARRIRHARVRNGGDFELVWSSVGGSAHNYCKGYWKKLDPLVHC